jgi:DNA-directed RNA polymerase subunit RPC12/RpoP
MNTPEQAKQIHQRNVTLMKEAIVTGRDVSKAIRCPYCGSGPLKMEQLNDDVPVEVLADRVRLLCTSCGQTALTIS